MKLYSFVNLAKHYDIPVDLSVTLHREELIEAEELRLKYEQRIADESGYRFVTTPHFTVNCETEEFTEEKFLSEYPDTHWHLVKRYVSIRSKRRDLYIAGGYKSFEIINGESYIDFFFKRNLFEKIKEDVWRRQYADVVDTNSLDHVQRYVYLRATPELPIVLCYSNGETLLRFDDVTISLSNDHFDRSMNSMREYVCNCKYVERRDVRDFLINPIRVGA
jgi:hypothetical protein